MKTYTAHVRGWIWQGCEASTEYTFDHKPTSEEVQARAGDFERIEEYNVTCTTTTVTACDDDPHASFISRDGWEDDGERGRR